MVLYRIDERIVRSLRQLDKFHNVSRGIEFLLCRGMGLASLGVFVESEKIWHRPCEIAWLSIDHPRLQIARLTPVINVILRGVGNRFANLIQYLFVREREIATRAAENLELYAGAIGKGRVRVCDLALQQFLGFSKFPAGD